MKLIQLWKAWRAMPARIAALELRIRELEQRFGDVDRLILNVPSGLVMSGAHPLQRMMAAPAKRAERITPRKWSDFRAAVEEGANHD